MTSQALNRPVDVLAHHVRGMRAASEGSGITLTAAACANLAKDLETVRATVGELIEALSDCVTDMQQTEEFYGTHPRAQEVIARAKAALDAIGSAK